LFPRFGPSAPLAVIPLFFQVFFVFKYLCFQFFSLFGRLSFLNPCPFRPRGRQRRPPLSPSQPPASACRPDDGLASPGPPAAPPGRGSPDAGRALLLLVVNCLTLEDECHCLHH
jgi:hypothetical protein